MAKVVTQAVQNIREVERHSGDLGRAKRLVDVIQYKLKHWKYIVEPSIHQRPDNRKINSSSSFVDCIQHWLSVPSYDHEMTNSHVCTVSPVCA